MGLLGRSAPQDAMLRTRGSRREARVETKTIGSDQFPPNRLGRSLHPSYLQRRMFLPQFLEVLLATGKLHEVEIIFTLTLLWEGEMPNKSCTKDLNFAQILQVLHKYFKSCINFPSSLSVFVTAMYLGQAISALLWMGNRLDYAHGSKGRAQVATRAQDNIAMESSSRKSNTASVLHKELRSCINALSLA